MILPLLNDKICLDNVESNANVTNYMDMCFFKILYMWEKAWSKTWSDRERLLRQDHD